jgi:hypothetical protein
MDPSRSPALDPEEVTSEALTAFTQTEPTLAWLRVLGTLQFARIVHAAVKLQIPQTLRDGPRTAGEIAEATATDAMALYRLLRALAAAGVLVESDGSRFGLTRSGDVLIGGAKPFSDSLLEFFDPSLIPLDGLIHTVKTGKPAFDERHGMPFYEYLARKAPDGGARFDASMSIGATMRSHALLRSADFASARTVVDVGGGDGMLLSAVLEAHPHLRGVVFEGAQTAARARARFDGRELGARAEVIVGDFFASVPGGGDVYVLSFVLHNWDDSQSVVLLEHCRRAMTDDAVLLIVEQVRVPTAEASLEDYLSLSTLELLGGRERTEAEFRAILERAGLRLTGVAFSPDVPFCVLEARTNTHEA